MALWNSKTLGLASASSATASSYATLGKPKGAIGASGGARATLLLINTALRDGVRPALIAIKPLKRLVFISRGEAPARQPVLIGTQRTTRAAGPIAMDSAGVRLPLSNRVR